MFDQKQYMRNYRKNNPKKVRYIDDRSAAHRFIKEATDEDLNALAGMIAERRCDND